MSFLQWLLQELIGEPPTSQHGDGQSTWDCPQCGHPRFHTMPDTPGFRHRAKCWRCDFRGDAADMLRWFRPVEGESYPELCNRLEVWRRRYEQEANRKGLQFHRGPGSTKPGHVCIRCKMRDSHYDPAVDAFDDESHAAMRAVLDYIGRAPSQRALVELLQLCEKILRICAEHNLHPLAFAQRCYAEAWVREDDARHMATCDDPDCDYRCCRLARGWTPEEIARDILAGKQERAEAKQRQADRVRRACRNVPHGNGRVA